MREPPVDGRSTVVAIDGLVLAARDEATTGG
jgi:hypothetical protein